MFSKKLTFLKTFKTQIYFFNLYHINPLIYIYFKALPQKYPITLTGPHENVMRIEYCFVKNKASPVVFTTPIPPCMKSIIHRWKKPPTHTFLSRQLEYLAALWPFGSGCSKIL